MKVKNKSIQKILEKYKEISLLNRTNALLDWDLKVNLPPKGGEFRSQQIAYLTKLTTEKWLDEEFKSLLGKVGQEKLGEEEKGIVRNLEHAGKFYLRVPKEVIVEFAETTSKAFLAWQDAKIKNNFPGFKPHLKKVIELNQKIAWHMGYKQNLASSAGNDNPYNALLDIYEPGLTAKEVEGVFKVLRPELTKILKKITSSKNFFKESGLIEGEHNYPIDDQKQLSLFVLREMNYDLAAGRMDVSSHPFTETLGGQDVRITNRYKVNDFTESLMVAMHEGGHALYEQGVKGDYELTPLEGGVSLGIHESQSRFWENQIGRSFEFITFLTPIFHAFYPEQLSQVGSGTLFSLFNRVRPSLIRTEADEVTYNLHIALRFELENDLINNKIKVDDLPEIWRAKMKDYLGVKPETDREGVLQDVHWSHGSFGYFPTYTLGNLYAAQFTAEMQKELNLEELSKRGELRTILSWLKENIHRYGSLYWPKELVKKVTGKALDPKLFLTYIKNKYKKIYKITL